MCKLDWISDIHYVCISDIQKQSVRQDIGCFMWKYSILVKIRVSLLYVTNRCIKVTCKLILPSFSRFKFCPYYKSRVKLILSNVIQLKLLTKRLLTVLKLITILLEQYCVIYFGFFNFTQKVLKVGR